jgi:Tfp pilus assembly protein PilN
MRVSVNLATRPFVELRPFFLRLRLVMAALVLAGLALAITAHVLAVKATRQQAEVDRLRDRTIAAQQGKLRTEQRLRQPQNAVILDRAHFLNTVFLRKSFSWTAVMMDLENVLPAGVQVTSIEPAVTADGQVIIRLRVAGERDRAVQLVRNLERSRRFLQPRLGSESAQNREQAGLNGQRPPVGAAAAPAGPPGVEFEILANYNPLPAGESYPAGHGRPAAAAAAAQADGRCGPGSRQRASRISAQRRGPARVCRTRGGRWSPAQSAAGSAAGGRSAMSSVAVIPPPNSSSVLRRLPRLTARARQLLTAVNLHYAGVAGLIVLNIYLLAHLLFVWQAVSASGPEALAQQRTMLTAAQIAATPLQGIDQKLAVSTQQADAFYVHRLPYATSQVAAELGALTTREGVRLGRVQYAYAPMLPGPYALTQVSMDASVSGDYRPVVGLINAMERDRLFFVISGITLTGQQTGQVNLRLRLVTYLRSPGEGEVVPEDSLAMPATSAAGAAAAGATR